ncbi:DUF3085 domain-containing protein [Edwardsiella piscicida]|uniref:DUF3085 domain-containing protein n=1 Tax=Edwardsiella TaxID=635 RepID=UPI00068E7281|nr:MULTISPECIES: DUF3085 domain-containing protein [Edwardsiella]EGA8339132.1 DUF3085 domain-containing protein [Salmonella enterica subsp. enterica serovar Saintpaul]EKG9744445.1 DUF3085 domain-containing protein [Salmonella enterica]NJS89694.1 DUF3085 domain-containing protein [Escherichia coli]EKS7763345.1 DUF3085 domain-containing protein [Edwardsiella ictaluri]EKS7789760.1 DUF3085 domain-containing protein [Edwardsiella ictaluri]
MSILRFDIQDVKKLLAELEAAEQFKPTIDDMFAREIKHIRRKKIRPSLMLVGDHGLYLITNAKLDGTPASRGAVAYAKGCNPHVDQDFDDNKCKLFGSSDGTITIQPFLAYLAVKQGKSEFRITCDPDHSWMERSWDSTNL